MKSLTAESRQTSAFTLVEVLIASVLASLVLGSLIFGSIALQRAFAASEHQALADADLIRVADYVARDIRCATSVDTTAYLPVVLSVTKGDYYDRRGTPAKTDDIPNNPVLGQSRAQYGTSPVNIRYLKSGTRICREVSVTDGGVTTTTPTWIADNVDNLGFSRSADGAVKITAEFAMRFSVRAGGANAPRRIFTMIVSPRIPTL